MEMTGSERKQKHGDKVREREGVRSRKYGGVWSRAPSVAEEA